MHRRLIPLALLSVLLLAGCDARNTFPPGMTDVEMWQGEQIREDTEIPNQYPDGTTREHLRQDAAGNGSDAAH